MKSIENQYEIYAKDKKFYFIQSTQGKYGSPWVGHVDLKLFSFFIDHKRTDGYKICIDILKDSIIKCLTSNFDFELSINNNLRKNLEQFISLEILKKVSENKISLLDDISNLSPFNNFFNDPNRSLIIHNYDVIFSKDDLGGSFLISNFLKQPFEKFLERYEE